MGQWLQVSTNENSGPGCEQPRAIFLPTELPRNSASHVGSRKKPATTRQSRPPICSCENCSVLVFNSEALVVAALQPMQAGGSARRQINSTERARKELCSPNYALIDQHHGSKASQTGCSEIVLMSPRLLHEPGRARKYGPEQRTTWHVRCLRRFRQRILVQERF